MEPTTENHTGQSKITDQLKDYIETRIKLVRYQAIEWVTGFVANLVTDILVIVFGAITFLFACITLALFLGDLLGASWKGFGCVALLFAIFAFIVKAGKKKMIEDPLVNTLINKIIKTKK
jgi:hypothetical protein